MSMVKGLGEGWIMRTMWAGTDMGMNMNLLYWYNSVNLCYLTHLIKHANKIDVRDSLVTRPLPCFFCMQY